MSSSWNSRKPRRTAPAVAIAFETAARCLTRGCSTSAFSRGMRVARACRSVPMGAERRAQLLAQLARVEVGGGSLDRFIHGGLNVGQLSLEASGSP